MAELTRIQVVTTGYTGAPGYTNLHFAGRLAGTALTAAAAACRKFFDDAKTALPNVHVATVDPSAEYHDQAGPLTGVAAIPSPPAATQGTGGANYAGGSGAVIHWLTGFFHNGREVRGKTFLVPLSASVYSVDGTISGTNLPAIQAAANNLIATAGITLVVWQHSTPGYNAIIPAVGASVPDRTAFLRSRRQ
jgi:hypothetical protein